MEQRGLVEGPRLVSDSSQVVRLVGPLDAFSAPAVEDALTRLVAERPALLVDLYEVPVLASGGLAMLERCRARAAADGHRLLLRARPGSIVQRVLQLAGPPGLAAALRGDHAADASRPGLV